MKKNLICHLLVSDYVNQISTSYSDSSGLADAHYGFRRQKGVSMEMEWRNNQSITEISRFCKLNVPRVSSRINLIFLSFFFLLKNYKKNTCIQL